MHQLHHRAVQQHAAQVSATPTLPLAAINSGQTALDPRFAPVLTQCVTSVIAGTSPHTAR